MISANLIPISVHYCNSTHERKESHFFFVGQEEATFLRMPWRGCLWSKKHLVDLQWLITQCFHSIQWSWVLGIIAKNVNREIQRKRVNLGKGLQSLLKLKSVRSVRQWPMRTRVNLKCLYSFFVSINFIMASILRVAITSFICVIWLLLLYPRHKEKTELWLLMHGNFAKVENFLGENWKVAKLFHST